MGRGVKKPTTKQVQARVKKAVLGEHVIFLKDEGVETMCQVGKRSRSEQPAYGFTNSLPSLLSVCTSETKWSAHSLRREHFSWRLRSELRSISKPMCRLTRIDTSKYRG